jgi:hypothetical protein
LAKKANHTLQCVGILLDIEKKRFNTSMGCWLADGVGGL